MHEAKLHDASCFLTLTYDDKHLPADGNLELEELQKFFKRLRHPAGPLRYFACGEYGESTLRPHYHVLLLNKRFYDVQLHSETQSGKLWRSPALNEIWGRGHCLMGDLTIESCLYVTRYVTKKLMGDRAKGRVPEFTTMSRRPGLGAEYYERYGHEVRTWDSVVVHGREVPPPRFYDTKFEKLDPEGFARTKRARRRKAELFKQDNTKARLRVRETLALHKLRAQRVRDT